MQAHKTVSREEWLEARRELLAKEKAQLKAKDALRRERARCPGSRSTRTMCSTGRTARRRLSDLFAGRSQLIVKHFMLGPDWKEGCVGCSFGADQLDGSLVHLINHDVMLVAISRAPYPKIAAFHKRMGWHVQVGVVVRQRLQLRLPRLLHRGRQEARQGILQFRGQDYMGDELPGTSVFTKDEAGEIFHTYSVFARGTELIGGVYGFLDVTPKGRNEPPGSNLTDWVRHHDKYEEKAGDSCCHG